MVNELPHFFYLTVKKRSVVYSIPDFVFLNPSDYKSGDLVVQSTGQTYELKTHKVLGTFTTFELKHQYGKSLSNSEISLNVFFSNYI